MPDLRISLSECVSVPEGTTILTAEATGAVIGFRLPTGEVLKPWVTYELAHDAEGNAPERNLTHDELAGYDVWPDLDLERTIDAEDDAAVPTAALPPS